MTAMGMSNATYYSQQQYAMQRNPENREYDNPFKVIYNQCFYGPLEQNLVHGEGELKFFYQQKKIVVSFTINSSEGPQQIQLPLRKLQSISHSEKGVVLHLMDPSSSLNQIEGILNPKKDVESMLKYARFPQTIDFARRQLIFLVDQTQPSIRRGSASAYLGDFHLYSRWLIDRPLLPKKKNVRQPHNTTDGRFLEPLDASKFTEFLQQLLLGGHTQDPSRIVYQYDCVRNHPNAPVAYQPMSSEWSAVYKHRKEENRSSVKRGHTGDPVLDVPTKTVSARVSPVDDARLRQNVKQPCNNNSRTHALLDPSTISLHDVTTAMNNISHESSGLEAEKSDADACNQSNSAIPDVLLPAVPQPVEKAPTPPPKKDEAIELLDDDDEMNGTSRTDPSKPKKKVVLAPETELARFAPVGGKSRDCISVSLADARVLAHGEMLNDSIVEFYLKYSLANADDKSLASRVHIFNSFLFPKLVEGLQADMLQKTQRSANRRFSCVAANFSKIRNWTRKIDIFSKDIIVVPINLEIHWFVIVIINPQAAKSDEARTQQQIDSARICTPPMSSPKSTHIIVLDSMPDILDVKRALTVDFILDYLEMEWMDKKKIQLDRQRVGKLYMKNVPKQPNYIDCGLYLLAFVEAIFRKPPTAEILNKPGLDFRDIYGNFVLTPLDHMRDKVIAVLKSVAGPENWRNLMNFEGEKKSGVTVLTKAALIDRARRPRRYSSSAYPVVEKAPGFIGRSHSEPPVLTRTPDSVVLRRE